MNDLVPTWLRNGAYLVAASLVGFGLSWLGIVPALADLVAKVRPGWRENVAVALSPLGGIGVAEMLSSKWFWNRVPKGIRGWAWKLLQCGTPDLGGHWEVSWTSNDPINEALLMAYRGQSAPTAAIENIQPKVYKGKLVLTVTPVEVNVRLFKAQVTEANNSTLARLYREANGDVVLTYLAIPTVPQSTARDSSTYNFSARLIFHPEGHGELRGSYHTDRGKWLGQNAAGEMTLLRAA